MSALTNLGHFYGSMRLARDILVGNVTTEPWWDVRAFSEDPWPPKEEWPPYDDIWITIGTGSVPPK